MKTRIGIVTSRWNCPGLNAVLKRRTNHPRSYSCTRFGVKAVQLNNKGHFGSIVRYQNYCVRHVPIADAINGPRLVPPNGEMVQTARCRHFNSRMMKALRLEGPA
jgi:6-phosphofructokinase